jgi:hypothetical protein
MGRNGLVSMSGRDAINYMITDSVPLLHNHLLKTASSTKDVESALLEALKSESIVYTHY